MHAARQPIDLITLSPWDRETVFNSLRKTHRICIAHEAVKQGGVGAEIAAVGEALVRSVVSGRIA